ncbi:DEAD/DEAH box helicase [Myxococcus qinghaiensis]|uniref:DEAD/DEAH box helicase n=1 Tax=Myxococcus qinghaiensis TaxID=2906758 RepID=UPI0020A781C9|nr:DEAD/DEAH box helicase [Myxococcus qinghaiensis]MCP3167952.1 DEAD/DEAH box helicase [Myxococcus qinghaiensis]
MALNESFREACLAAGLDDTERNVALWHRKLQSPSDGNWEEAENNLLRLNLDFASLGVDALFKADGKEDLAASLLARASGNSYRAQAKYATRSLATLAAVGFAAAGNFSTAAVYANKALEGGAGNAGPFERWVLRLIASRVRDLDPGPLLGLVQYVRALKRYFLRGNEVDHQEATDSLLLFYAREGQFLPDFDQYLFLFWEMAQRRFSELCAARCLSDAGFENHSYVESLVGDVSPLLFPTQVKALEVDGLVRGRANSIVLLPTSTGKSLLGELAIVGALTEERPLGVYLAPYRALADQLHRRMQGRLGGVGIRCEMRRGGYLESTLEFGAGSKTLLVSTPEAFDSLLRSSPQLMSKIACCVFDEFHLVEQGARGIRYEGLVARLLSMPVEQRAKIVALSPVLTLADNLASWLAVSPSQVIRSDWRPTGRRLAVAGPDREIHYYTPGERLREDADASIPDWSGSTEFPNQIQASPNSQFSHVLKRHREGVRDNVAAVVVEQHGRLNAPVLVVASTRAESRELAEKIANLLSPLDEDHRLSVLARELIEKFPHLYSLQTCLRRGVAYHNAALPSWVRERVEGAIEEQLCRVVASTTTLAEGVDLPFRVVVIANWQQYRYGMMSPLPTLLFRNIAGRCGRAGVFAEGDTVIVDVPTREPSNNYVHRRREYYRLYIRPADIRMESSIVRALSSEFAAVQTKALEDVVPVVESLFAAQLDAFQPSEEQEDSFVSSFLAAQDSNARQVLKGIVVELIDDMLGVADYPLFVRNSPLALTPLGVKVVQTGLSPRSGLELSRLAAGFQPVGEPRKGKVLRQRHGIVWESLLAEIADRLVARKIDVKELTGDVFRSVGRRGFPVNEENFQAVLLAWVSGLPLSKIAYLTLRDKEVKAQVGSWLEEETGQPPEGFEDVLEQVAVFCGSYVVEQWGWVLRAGLSISSFMGNAELAEEFSALATRVEFGIRNPESALILRRRCPIDRAKVDALVGEYIAAASPASFLQEGFLSWLQELLGRDSSTGMGIESVVSRSEVIGLVQALMDL